jgi:hypothetical protein
MPKRVVIVGGPGDGSATAEALLHAKSAGRCLERQAEVSKWPVRRKIKLIIDTVVSFSSPPMRLISATGMVTAALSFLYAFSRWMPYFMDVESKGGRRPLSCS